MTESRDSYDTDPFPLILDAHIHGHITDDERDQLIAWAYPNAGREAPEHVRPNGQSQARQWMSMGMRRAADELESLLDRTDGDSVNVGVLRAIAAKLRRDA